MLRHKKRYTTPADTLKWYIHGSDDGIIDRMRPFRIMVIHTIYNPGRIHRPPRPRSTDGSCAGPAWPRSHDKGKMKENTPLPVRGATAPSPSVSLAWLDASLCASSSVTLPFPPASSGGSVGSPDSSEEAPDLEAVLALAYLPTYLRQQNLLLQPPLRASLETVLTALDAILAPIALCAAAVLRPFKLLTPTSTGKTAGSVAACMQGCLRYSATTPAIATHIKK